MSDPFAKEQELLPGVGEPWKGQCHCLPGLGGQCPQVSQRVAAPAQAPHCVSATQVDDDPGDRRLDIVPWEKLLFILLSLWVGQLQLLRYLEQDADVMP